MGQSGPSGLQTASLFAAFVHLKDREGPPPSRFCKTHSPVKLLAFLYEQSNRLGDAVETWSWERERLTLVSVEEVFPEFVFDSVLNCSQLNEFFDEDGVVRCVWYSPLHLLGLEVASYGVAASWFRLHLSVQHFLDLRFFSCAFLFCCSAFQL